MARLYFPLISIGKGIWPLESGARMYTYEVGTTTPKTVYSDNGMTIPHSNPVIADANGIFPETFGEGKYKIIFKNAADVTVYTVPEVDTLLDGNDIPDGIETPVPYGSLLNMQRITQAVDYHGRLYVPRYYSLPFTTTGTWTASDETKFTPLELPSEKVSDVFDSISALIAGWPSGNQIFVRDYHPGWAATVSGPYTTGFYLHRTGGTNLAPSAGAATTVSSVGTGTQGGFYYDANGKEWGYMQEHVDVGHFGIRNDGVATGAGSVPDPTYLSGQNAAWLRLVGYMQRISTSGTSGKLNGLDVYLQPGHYNVNLDLITVPSRIRMHGGGISNTHICFYGSYKSPAPTHSVGIRSYAHDIEMNSLVSGAGFESFYCDFENIDFQLPNVVGAEVFSRIGFSYLHVYRCAFALYGTTANQRAVTLNSPVNASVGTANWHTFFVDCVVRGGTGAGTAAFDFGPYSNYGGSFPTTTHWIGGHITGVETAFHMPSGNYLSISKVSIENVVTMFSLGYDPTPSSLLNNVTIEDIQGEVVKYAMSINPVVDKVKDVHIRMFKGDSIIAGGYGVNPDYPKRQRIKFTDFFGADMDDCGNPSGGEDFPYRHTTWCGSSTHPTRYVGVNGVVPAIQLEHTAGGAKNLLRTSNADGSFDIHNGTNAKFTIGPTWIDFPLNTAGLRFGTGTAMRHIRFDPSTANPNGAVAGYPGDIYVYAPTGGTGRVYFKQSGDNTSTNWAQII